MPFFNKEIWLEISTALRPMWKSQIWPPRNTEDNELVKEMQYTLSAYLFQPVSRFPFPTSFPKQTTLLEMLLICYFDNM